MDPLSITASAITLLGATGGTIRVVCDAMKTFKDAPREIKAQSKSLEAFCLTIDKLKQVCKQIPDEFPLMLDLCGIEELIEEAQLLERKLKTKSVRATAGNVGRVRESCSWVLSEKQSQKFFKSLNTWNIILTQALSVAQLTFSQRIHEHTTCLVNLPNLAAQIASTTARNSPSLGDGTICAMTQIHINQRSPPQTSPAQKRQSAVLSRMSEPVGMILVHRYHRDLAVVGLKLRGGRVILKRWSDVGVESQSTLPRSQGYSCSLVFMSPRITRQSLVVSFSMYQAPVWPSSLNIRWNFRMRRTMPKNSSCLLAIRMGDLQTIRYQLSSGKIHLTDNTFDGNSLLHFAVIYNQPSIVTFLLNEGMDVNTVNDRGRTPLHLAVQNNNAYECVRRLLDNGADVLQQDEIGKSPLHTFYNEISMKIMLRCREDIDPWMQDKGGMTVLHWVAWSRRSTLNLLPQSHQNTNGLSCLEIKDGEGKSMLHYAVQRGNLDLITFFLASPYAMAMSMADFSGLSLLHYATESSQADIIDLLLDANCELDAADAKGRTVLHHAAARDNILAVRRLIQLGASHQLACEDCDGRTPLELARYREAKSVAEYLQSLGQEHNGGETTKLESTNVEGIAPSLHLHQVQMAIAFLVLIILFQSLLLWL